MSKDLIDQILIKLGNIQSDVAVGVSKIEGLEEGQKNINLNIEALKEDKSDFRVFCAEQIRINSKINGNYENLHKQIEAMPETVRREIFGKINKLESDVEFVKKDHSEEKTDKRKTWAELTKHAITASLTLLAGLIGLKINQP